MADDSRLIRWASIYYADRTRTMLERTIAGVFSSEEAPKLWLAAAPGAYTVLPVTVNAGLGTLRDQQRQKLAEAERALSLLGEEW